ncbi:hypothetical protein HNP77_001156 [Treponema rectale]|uniref:Uncharacterized protein n=1 Tax=Treponema rectale TaxID=744512 RepID=A0A840SAQ1_9SPIR|nr:hypothetical protein [Treponema rectale]MBB5218787.1 hypothetical protein [Treponema rectale]
MKKLMAVLAGLLLVSAMTFADKVIKADDMNSKWAVGKWDLEISMNDGTTSETEHAVVDITGKKDSSKVLLTADEEEEEMTLEELKDLMFNQLPGQIPLTDDIIEQASNYGITIEGDTSWRLSDNKKKLYFGIKIVSADGEMEASMIFTKQE